ncbi:MAG: hypothetical protein ACKOTB_16180, partial [Planctomycetia bacterium]
AEPPVVSALSRPDCLTVAGAVLVSAAGKGQPYGPPPSLAERLSLVSGRVPALAEWLATAAETSTAPATVRQSGRLSAETTGGSAPASSTSHAAA